MELDEQHKTRALVVDDDRDVAEFVKIVLEGAGCEVRRAWNGDQALAVAEWFQPEIVFLDVVIPEQMGWLVCAKLKMAQPAPVVVVVTGVVEEANDRFAEFVHADLLIRKPFSEADILRPLTELVLAD